MFWGDIWSVVLRYGEQQELQPELKIDKTQTQVDLQFLSRSDQFKRADLAPQIQKLPEIKIVCSSIFVFIKTAVSHNPLSATNPKLTEFSLFQQTTSKLAGSEPATNCKKSTDRQRFPSSNVRKLSDNCCWFRQHIQGVHLLFLKNFNIRQLLKKRC